MSITVNTPVQFTFILKVMTGTPPTAISLLTSDPDGISDYDQDGITIGAVYTAPDANNEGSYVFTKSFAKPDSWILTLCNGVSDNYTALYTERLSVIAGDNIYVVSIRIGT